jgi:4-alpha-glucanotransferase
MLTLLEAEGGLEPNNADISSIRDAVHTFLSRTRSMLTLVQLDDLTDEIEQVNVPSTTSEVLNWRRRQSATLEELASGSTFRNTAGAMRRERGDPR